jgi:alpha-tubulin suppressor-like RCC1 family protein
VKGLTGVVKVALGSRQGLALKDDGTVWEWGRDYLGPGYTVKTTWPTPRRVGGLTGVAKIAAGSYHSLALRGDGTVWAWGDNQYGQLGDGRAMNRLTPVQVVPLGSPATTP